MSLALNLFYLQVLTFGPRVCACVLGCSPFVDEVFGSLHAETKPRVTQQKNATATREKLFICFPSAGSASVRLRNLLSLVSYYIQATQHAVSPFNTTAQKQHPH